MTITDQGGNPLPPNDPRVIVVQQPPPPPPQAEPPEVFSREQLLEFVENARKEEKDKLYGTLNTMDERLKVFEAERQALADDAQAAIDAKAEADRLAAQQEMTIAERQQALEEQWETKFNEQEQRLATQQAIFEKEREFQQIASYRNTRLAELQDQIDPRFHDFIGGTTPEEIEASLFIAAQKTAEIGQEFQQYISQQQGALTAPAPAPRTPGVPVTSGPGYTPDQWTQQLTAQETTLTPEDIKNIPMSEYANPATREALLEAASRSVREKGLYG